MVFVYICPAPVPTQHGVGGISVALIKFCSLMLLVWFCGFQTRGEMENLICSTFVVAYQYKPGFSAENKTKRCILNHSHRLKAAGTANCTEQRQHAWWRKRFTAVGIQKPPCSWHGNTFTFKSIWFLAAVSLSFLSNMNMLWGQQYNKPE